MSSKRLDELSKDTPEAARVLSAAHEAARNTAPYWPLRNFVAVNPMLGLTDLDLGRAGALLAKTHGALVMLPRSVYADALEAGRITDADLAGALADHGSGITPGTSAAALRVHARQSSTASVQRIARLDTLADVAARVSGTDFAHIVRERISRWAADHFDEGVAAWPSPWRHLPPWQAWKAHASVDRSFDVAGLRGHRQRVQALPSTVAAMLEYGVAQLRIPEQARSLYFQRLLADLPGWSGYARYLGWDSELAGDAPDSVLPFLAIRLAHEVLLALGLDGRVLRLAWRRAANAYTVDAEMPAGREATLDLLLHLAYERSSQRRLAASLMPGPDDGSDDGAKGTAPRPRAQAVFCIDVRSERMRRALETVAADVDTLGFAGFFGVALAHRRSVTDRERALCPVLLRPSVYLQGPSRGEPPRQAPPIVDEGTRVLETLRKGAVASFAYVEAFGLLRAVALVRETFAARSAGAEAPSPARNAPAGIDIDPELDTDARTNAAAGMLHGMSLTADQARLIVLVGHGATSANNPHGSSLDCGACGGHAGDLNARAAVRLLNDPDVRAGLRARGLSLAEDCLFVAALHDTTTDDVRVLDAETIPPSHRAELARLEDDFTAAAARVRSERAPALGLADTDDLESALRQRARNWSQVRPEWGLAGCAGFVAAPRTLTRERDLGGRVFLHSYDWRADPQHEVLEAILTAPLVVASWISLQYFASSMDNAPFGAGDKTLHNVVGGIGVLEGNGGDLRTGLPLQSVDTGKGLAHEPVRLAAFVAAPLAALDAVLDRHPELRALLANGWVRLHRLDDAGRTTHRFGAYGCWDALTTGSSPALGRAA